MTFHGMFTMFFFEERGLAVKTTWSYTLFPRDLPCAYSNTMNLIFTIGVFAYDSTLIYHCPLHLFQNNTTQYNYLHTHQNPTMCIKIFTLTYKIQNVSYRRLNIHIFTDDLPFLPYQGFSCICSRRHSARYGP